MGFTTSQGLLWLISILKKSSSIKFLVRLSPFSEACLAVSKILKASSFWIEGMKFPAGITFSSGGIQISFLNFSMMRASVMVCFGVFTLRRACQCQFQAQQLEQRLKWLHKMHWYLIPKMPNSSLQLEQITPWNCKSYYFFQYFFISSSSLRKILALETQAYIFSMLGFSSSFFTYYTLETTLFQAVTSKFRGLFSDGCFGFSLATSTISSFYLGISMDLLKLSYLTQGFSAIQILSISFSFFCSQGSFSWASGKLSVLIFQTGLSYIITPVGSLSACFRKPTSGTGSSLRFSSRLLFSKDGQMQSDRSTSMTIVWDRLYLTQTLQTLTLELSMLLRSESEFRQIQSLSQSKQEREKSRGAQGKQVLINSLSSLKLRFQCLMILFFEPSTSFIINKELLYRIVRFFISSIKKESTLVKAI